VWLNLTSINAADLTIKVGFVCILLFLFFYGFKWMTHNPKLRKYYKKKYLILFVACIITYFVLLFLFSNYAGFQPYNGDTRIIQESAMAIAQGYNYNEHLPYFSRWFNNVTPLYLLAALYKAGLTLYDGLSKLIRLPVERTIFAENCALLINICNVGIAMVSSFTLLYRKNKSCTPLYMLFF
jgi:hypothetical protein